MRVRMCVNITEWFTISKPKCVLLRFFNNKKKSVTENILQGFTLATLILYKNV